MRLEDSVAALDHPKGGWPSVKVMEGAINSAHYDAAEKLDAVFYGWEDQLRRILTPEEKIQVSNDLIIEKQIRQFRLLGVRMKRVRI